MLIDGCYDPATAATIEGAPKVGTRIEIEWSDPDRWEKGRVTEHVVELDHRGRAAIRCRACAATSNTRSLATARAASRLTGSRASQAWRTTTARAPSRT